MNLIIHPDELFLKGANQRFFYNTLIKNLKALFNDIKVNRIESGLWLTDFKQTDLERLDKIPGIANYAVAFKDKNDLKTIEKNIDKLIDKKAKTFRITVNRSNKNYKLNSLQIASQLGDYVRKKHNLKVDLQNYDLNIYINILKDQAIIYTNPLIGAGGLPTGSSGKLLCLLSGGIDSPVAAYQMMCRGGQIGLIHFQNQTQVSGEVGEKIFDLAKTLAQYQPNIELFMIPFAPIQKQIIMKIPADYRMIISRRIFFTIAQKVGQANQYLALITGDSLGQVASQTIDNLDCIYQSTDLLNFSPLIGCNKTDIIKIARKIKTLEISNRPYEDCCSLFVAKHPQTKAKLDQVLQLNKQINLPALDKLLIKSYNFSMNN